MLIKMIPEIGHYALIVALLMACVQAVLPLAGAATRRPLWMAYARPMAAGQLAFLLIAYGCLTASYMLDDFSVVNVANNANSLLPWYYKFSAVWGNHEGSVLLWSLILGVWTFAVGCFSRGLPPDMVARVLGVMGLVSVGFLAFVLITSNPFERSLPNIPADGADLNPLLQDVGLIIHPPMLYMGYVGFSVVFAFAIAALLGGRLDSAWTRWVRPWTNIAWAFLTVGIALGSWWAYYELGWGGWWFWDPVENASLLPWLAGTALIHSLAVTEKRGTFKSWTVLLAITTFSLSLMGTFLVRSGVLTSVHAFANDPSRGLFILVLLGITVGLSLLIFALRAPRVSQPGGFNWVSRDALLLVNNILLVVMTVTVLLGTVYPLLLDALNLGKISVGPPYFNALFVPLTVLLCVFMGLGPSARWKRMAGRELLTRLWFAGLGALVIGVAAPLVYTGQWNLKASLGLVAALWLVLSLVRDLWGKTSRAGSRLGALKRLTPAYWGMVLGHLGLAVTIIGVALVSNYSVERNVRMNVGDRVEVNGIGFHMTALDERRGPNYVSDAATIEVTREGASASFEMHPEKRLYIARGMPMTQVALRPGLFHDLYVAMGEELDDGSWALRVQIKPFVRWLWLGALLMAAGGIIAVADRRYRRRLSVREPEPVVTAREASAS
ncbi:MULTISPECIES: heme lyase CcmF/NrfE family subunit [unclassified Halomonas]|uniref:heme lyase CcmF/NrfE family subunit n=1 Tax=unclassified Halomonas TaxID=2609666 RepID=UPI000C986D8E|nr:MULTISPECIES: heme lyase CcmF/NrfE family subunit [unclassified Halomonas]MAR74456.1 heme lyase NrfEFG subunit NrfE [Halomonas sp.]MBR9880415.1 heme lyase CcmF/NrfE family subunit [Gammaproteobacteria bacterium]|tara:strand:- start:3075 stop:5075 length:2001 start_codon:yes stop_codon:yes gene_type:complete